MIFSHSMPKACKTALSFHPSTQIPAKMSDSLLKYETKVLLRSVIRADSGETSPLHSREALRDSLSLLLPPILTVEDDEEWVQFVSTKPATAQDVRRVEEKLDRLLEKNQARETGVCPIREKLCAGAFDEVIRQVAISSFHRGQLLARIRDNSKETVRMFKRLFESCVGYGLRKQLGGEYKEEKLKQTIVDLEEACEGLERDVKDLEQEIATLRQHEQETEETHQARHRQQALQLSQQNEALSGRLESLLLDTKR